MFARFERGHFRAEFGHDRAGDAKVDAGHGGEIDATNPIQLGAQVELGLVRILAGGLVFFAARDARGWWRLRRGDRRELGERGFDVAVAGGDLET